jgi:hypothetical protein
MKRVTGFNPKVHCARCLIGHYVQEVGRHLVPGEPCEFRGCPGDVFYLCGVSNPYRWTNNLHLPFVVEPGSNASVTAYTGDVVTITGARQLPFDISVAAELYPDLGMEFLTCRNFQFGAYHFKDK